eukprot:TRINITY_DN4724_c0_g1_i1.p1 TRINITY_DN4724_c0_g1~~TRINITY_DN4724_c0_g1_i1.p1  ORF type:complete len:271 (-),score=45.70 TRINITY_DN4724_c0_g1_i1:46-858(-)
MEENKREIIKVKEYSDLLDVFRFLREKAIISHDKPYAHMIGCSSHSLIQVECFDELVTKIGEKICKPYNISVLWGGGDIDRMSKGINGRNVADIKKELINRKYISLGIAFQREDWTDRTPEFEKIVVSYSSTLATVGGKKTFGGYVSLKQLPKDMHLFYEHLKEIAINKDLLTEGFYPVASSMAFLMSTMASSFILIVIPRAGIITFHEVTYVRKLLDRKPNAPILVFGILWKKIHMDLNDKSSNCKLKETLALLKLMAKKHPSKVKLVE